MTERRMTPIFDGYNNVFTVSGPNGKDEGHDFLLELDKRPQAQFKRHLTRLRDGHHVASPDNMRFLSSNDPTGRGAQVHELKVHYGSGFRLYVVRWNAKWYVTHGARKPKDRQVPKQIRRAFDIFHSDL